jgi:hypothetical protein
MVSPGGPADPRVHSQPAQAGREDDFLVVGNGTAADWPTDLSSWERYARQVAGRDMTPTEWAMCCPTAPTSTCAHSKPASKRSRVYGAEPVGAGAHSARNATPVLVRLVGITEPEWLCQLPSQRKRPANVRT